MRRRIKRRNNYSGIFRTRRRRGPGALKIIITIILLAALIFIGYSISDPLIQLFSGKFKPTAASSSKESSSAAQPTSSVSSSSVTSSASEANTATIRGAYLPKKYLSNITELNEFIAQAKSAGINLAVIDLKAEDGIVNYASKVSEAKNTVANGAPDASAAAKALSDAGITPAARICAFQDPVAPKVLRGAGVMYYKNHSMNWIDPSGDRWLNPNSPQAQQYITSLATEAVSLGYKQIFIDSVTFPTKGNPDKTGYFGDMTSKEQVISNYLATLKQQVNAAGGKLTVMTTGAAAVGQAKQNTGLPQNIFTLSGDYISPNFCPSLLDSGMQIGTTTIKNPDLTPGDTVNALAQFIKGSNSSSLSTAVPIIQAYTNSKAKYRKYKQYTADDIKAEITALNNAGIQSYILYNPQGIYDFSSLK